MHADIVHRRPTSQDFHRSFRGIIRNLRSFRIAKVGFGKGGSFGKGSFQKSPFSRDSRVVRDSRDSREPQTMENKGESDYSLESLENLEIR